MKNSPIGINFFKTIVRYIDNRISDDALEYLVAGLKEKHLKKKDIVLEPFAIHNQISFIVEGTVRGFYINDKGDEITTRFIDKGGFVTDYRAFLEQTKSEYYFQCLEPTTLLCFSYEYINKGYAQKPELERFGRLVSEAIVKILENRMRSFHFMDAEKRYIQFIEQKPELANKISIKHLSTYLGITRPSLSRIRKKLLTSPKR